MLASAGPALQNFSSADLVRDTRTRSQTPPRSAVFICSKPSGHGWSLRH
jgi:hypothetical protein